MRVGARGVALVYARGVEHVTGALAHRGRLPVLSRMDSVEVNASGERSARLGKLRPRCGE